VVPGGLARLGWHTGVGPFVRLHEGPWRGAREVKMRVLEGEQMMVRIFLGEDDRWHGQLLHVALLERFRKEGIAGATVFRGVSGFGARSIVHSTHLLRMSEDLPLLVEVVDTAEHIERMLPIIDAMVSEGLVTVEKVRVIKYAPGAPPASSA
jgi:uncharacterized protein